MVAKCCRIRGHDDFGVADCGGVRPVHADAEWAAYRRVGCMEAAEPRKGAGVVFAGGEAGGAGTLPLSAGLVEAG